MNDSKRKRNPFIARILSLFISGLGQLYGGKWHKGAAILFTAIVIANLNIIVLPLIAMANPLLPPSSADANALWRYWIRALLTILLHCGVLVFGYGQ